MPAKMRIDQLLVERGFFKSRSAAQASIEAERVMVDGYPVYKSSLKVSVGAEISAAPAHPYVSRGGVKLAHALEVFGVDPAGLDCIDLGASTGGFTDVLLQRGAANVLSVDVGRDQLHERLREDPRVVMREQTDIRDLNEVDIAPTTRLIVADLSFISLEKALPNAIGFAPDSCALIVLFKPQFEVGRDNVGKGGIVTDFDAVEKSKGRFENWLLKSGWSDIAWTDSPITGGDGNREYLCCARKVSVP